jgi:DNA-binding NtrC family response regulator
MLKEQQTAVPGPVIGLVDDDQGFRELIGDTLRRFGFEVIEGKTGLDAMEIARNERPALLICDIRMPEMTGLEVLAQITSEKPEIPVLLITAHGEVPDAVEAIRGGALDYLQKPVDLNELIEKVERVVGVSIEDEWSGDITVPPHVVGQSPAMRQVFHDIARVAPTNATVLITGESGTGKEVIADLIHQQSPRKTGPMVKVNCAAIPEHLVESQLFGHTKGAFTGAAAAQAGDFEHADHGTLMLDEIGEMPIGIQPKLLRALETRRIRRLGSNKETEIDVRLIAATNQDLLECVKNRTFREDLLYRINVFVIHLPPLRERKEDILPLAELMLSALGYGEKRLAPSTQRLLSSHDWPGNVRELRNTIERAAIVARGSLILPTDLPPTVHESEAIPKAAAGSVLVGDMDEIRKRAILEALEKTGGNKTKAAEILGISRRSLIYKLREYGL